MTGTIKDSSKVSFNISFCPETVPEHNVVVYATLDTEPTMQTIMRKISFKMVYYKKKTR